MAIAHRKNDMRVDAHKEIREAVFVDIAGCGTQKRSLLIQANFLAHIAKGSVAQVPEEPRRIRRRK